MLFTDLGIIPQVKFFYLCYKFIGLVDNLE